MKTMVGEIIRIHFPKLEDDSPKVEADGAPYPEPFQCIVICMMVLHENIWED